MEEIDIMELLKLFWKRKIVIVLITLLGLIVGFIYNSHIMTPKYKATATFLLTSSNSEEGTITTTDVTLNSKIINNYTELIKSDTILDEVVSSLNLKAKKQEIKKSISVSVKKETEFVELSVSLPDKVEATEVANKITEVLTEKVKEIYNMENLRVIDNARVPDVPYNINPVKYAAIGAAIGFILICTIIAVMYIFDDSIKSEAEVENKLNVPVLATFRKQRNFNISDWNPKLDYVEGFKVLRTNLQFSTNMKDKKIIAVTSCFPGEGKSWVTSNLAIAFSKADYRVLVIDADLRKGVQHLNFGVNRKPGLIQLLNSKERIEGIDTCKKYITETKFSNVFVLPSGGNTSDSSELLLSNKLKQAISTLEETFDIIIFDSTPGVLVSDASVLSRIVDTNVIVSESEKTGLRDLKKVKNSIENVGGMVSGIVVNKVDDKKSKKSYYYYGYNENLPVAKKEKHARHDSEIARSRSKEDYSM